MFRLRTLLLPLTFVAVACDEDEPTDGEVAEADVEIVERDADRSEDREARIAAKFAKLDADGNGSISEAEIAGHGKLAALFDEADGDGDGALSRDEFTAFKKAHHRGKHGGKHGRGDKGDRAAKILAELDKDADGAISKEEAAGHRFLGEKFAMIDTDADGKLTSAELGAFKGKRHHERKQVAG
jgi:Ca2+-binding EF-hand superfamily protein